MMKLSKTLVTASALLVLLAACGGGGGGGGGGTPPVSSVIVTACTGTIDATVDAVGITNWNPGAVTIATNQVVRWNNTTSGVDHTVTSTTVPANGTFNVALPINGSVCLQFTVAGTFNYNCSIHPVMTGSVTVN